MKLTEESFWNNSFVLSMVGSGDKYIRFCKVHGVKPKVVYGLNTSSDYIFDLKYNHSNLIDLETQYYINRFSGALGCHMNHFYAIQRALMDDYDFVVILEDDAELVGGLDGLIAAADELPNNFDALVFGWIPSIAFNERKNTPKEYSSRLYLVDGLDRSGAFGYLLSRHGMKDALTALSDIRIPSDLQFKFMNSFYTKTPVFNHPPASAPSRIRK